MTAPAKQRAARARGRPHAGFTRTLEAAALAHALTAQGLSERRACDAVYKLLGISRNKVQSQHRVAPIQPLDAHSEWVLGLWALAQHWDSFVRPNWHKLTRVQKQALRPLVSRLLRERPPN